MRSLLTKDIANDLGLNLRTVQKYIKEGFLPASIDYSQTTKQYCIDPQVYHEWKQTQFNGVKKSLISKYTRAGKPITKLELLSLIPDWLNSLTNGTFNGKVYSPRTIETYAHFIKYYLKALGAHPEKPLISRNNLKRVFNSIAIKQYATKQKIYDALMCFSSYLIEAEHINDINRDDLKKLKPRRFLPPERITLSEKQIEHAIDVSQKLPGNNSYAKLLTKTLIIFLKETGLRASELCNLKPADIDLENRRVNVWHGKGNKNRKVGITQACYEALVEYWQTSKPLNNLDYFFVSKRGTNLTRNSLRLRWDRLTKACGFKITSHSFRRAFVTINVNRGKPLVHLQIAAGHADITTTRSYCQTSEDEVIEAMRGWS